MLAPTVSKLATRQLMPHDGGTVAARETGSCRRLATRAPRESPRATRAPAFGK